MSRDSFVFERNFTPMYREIVEDFGFSTRKDEVSRDLLDGWLPPVDHEDYYREFKKIVEGRDVLFFGGGPSIGDEASKRAVLSAKRAAFSGKFVTGAADGASRLFLEHRTRPDIVFTDLDGLSVVDLQELLDRGSHLVIHAHGDNIPALEEMIGGLNVIGHELNVVGTTQAEPVGRAMNPGGFTDGDRGICFLSHIVAKERIYMIGMDFGTVVGKYSKPHFTGNAPASNLKRKKLEWGEKITKWAIREKNLDVWSVGSSVTGEGINSITDEEFLNTIEEVLGPRG
ncbi:MAG: 6-hydroxymethylpterin diphosphokinase MptE-like protein [Promethearchaeota archaeon]